MSTEVPIPASAAAKRDVTAVSSALVESMPGPQASGNVNAKRAPKARNRNPASRVPAKRRILVVDDVADVTEMIALFLKHAGFEVMTANSARSALQISAENHFDLIISDIGMPEMNGYDLAESLRKDGEHQTVPMIAVTGYTEYDDRGRSLEAGFNAHLTKPINPSRLLSVISELLT